MYCRAPIVQETVRQDRVVEVQPVLHREVDKNIVHHIEKHSFESAPSQGGVIERQPIVEQQMHTSVVNGMSFHPPAFSTSSFFLSLPS